MKRRSSQICGERAHARRWAKRARRCALALLLAGFAWGCARPPSSGLTTGETVRQEKPKAARGLGGYRSVEMPEEARRNLVEADPKAPGAVAYVRSLPAR